MSKSVTYRDIVDAAFVINCHDLPRIVRVLPGLSRRRLDILPSHRWP
jgi:hypothetical protein